MTRSDPEGPSGLLLIDKPVGPTSHDVVRQVRRALGTRGVGHAGTLDPFATGLLACCAGNATRLLRFFAGSSKTYEGEIRLGFATDTGDPTGQPLTAGRPVGDAVHRAAVAVEEGLTGDLQQVPPMFSAKKIQGVPLHEMARRGETVERRPVPVRVTGWSLEPLGDDRIRFRVTCSAGTYVRVLASDLGEMLGCGAHLASLRRVASGALLVEHAVGLAELDRTSALAGLVPLDVIPLPLPEMRCADEAVVRAFRHGAASARAAWEGDARDGEVACRGGSGELLGIGIVDPEHAVLRPDVVLPERG